MTTSQLLLVLSPDWNSVEGTMYVLERKQSLWTLVHTIDVDVGQQGMAWGSGLHETPVNAPIKVEGDRKAPAGIFALKRAFGQSTAPEGLKLPYMQITDTVEFIDDPSSVFYNTPVEPVQVVKDWNSSEKMREIGNLYEWGIIVEHNTTPTEPGKGSCIFIHVRRGKGLGTGGCTAMDKQSLFEILSWLDPEKLPCLAQLPYEAYNRYCASWGLPDVGSAWNLRTNFTSP